MSKVLIGTGTTDSNGVATLDTDPNGQTISGYTGTGAGEVDLIATTTIDSRTIVSQPVSVLDCKFVDYGTTGHDSTNYTKNIALTEEVVADGVKITSPASNSTAKSYTCNTTFTNDFTALIEVKTDESGLRVGVIDSNSKKAFASFNQSNFTQVKVTKTSTSLTVQQYMNGEWVDLEINNNAGCDYTDTCRFNLYCYNTSTVLNIIFKNLYLYPI